VQMIVEAQSVCRRFGEGEAAVDALSDVSVGFPKGRFAAIMGPSGSGKSTLMHILAGLDRPTSGSVKLDEVELTDLDDRRLTQLRRDRIGFIFQTFNLLPVLSAEENILLPLSIAGRKPDEEWRLRVRLSHGRLWCSPTSRRGTSTRRHPAMCCPCCVMRWTTSARRSSWSPTTPTPRRLPIDCWCSRTGASSTMARGPRSSRPWIC